MNFEYYVAEDAVSDIEVDSWEEAEYVTAWGEHTPENYERLTLWLEEHGEELEDFSVWVTADNELCMDAYKAYC